MGRWLAGILLAGLVAGCATGLSEEKCTQGNWESIGFSDGRDGEPLNKLADRTEQCERFDIAVEDTRYRAGWEQGNALFCTPEGALSVALNGRGDVRVCEAPSDLTLRAWRVGRDFHRAENALEQAENNYRNAQNSIRRDRNTISETQKKIRNEKTEDGVKKLEKRLRDTRKRLDRTRRNLPNLEYEITRADIAYRRARRDLDDLEFDIRRARRAEAPGIELKTDITFRPLMSEPPLSVPSDVRPTPEGTPGTVGVKGSPGPGLPTGE